MNVTPLGQDLYALLSNLDSQINWENNKNDYLF